MNEESGEVKMIPYGITDYELIRKENYYYVDKTRYLVTVKQAGRYLFFIRPRRFGKSLFLNMMASYYDILKKDQFEELFKGTWIHEHPTDDQGSYLVLKFNFSLVNPNIDQIETSFLEHVRDTAKSFTEKYSSFLQTGTRDYYSKAISQRRSSSDILSALSSLCRDAKQKLYVIIDEYDNFANTLLSTSGEDAYKKLIHGAGGFRSFFNVLKGGTTDSGAPFSRLFLTGVSPVTMDDVTSGYNIGKNVSMDYALNAMLGFTWKEVESVIDYYRKKNLINTHTTGLMEIMSRWYGNYLFSEEDGEKLFNADMVLYFLDQYINLQKPPKELVDRNVRIDYGKLKHLMIVDQGPGKTPSTNGNFSKLKEIIETSGTSAKIAKGFPLENITDPENFKSLLFYFGLLTMDGVEREKVRLIIPNETVRQLFYTYIEEAYRETHTFSLDLSRYTELIGAMAYEGRWRPLFDFITGRMRESMSLRDLITGEKSIHAFLNVYLGLSNLYIIHRETEKNKGYADLVMEPFLARYEGIKYAYMLEIKYLKAGAKPEDAAVQSLKKEAEAQLAAYNMDEAYNKSLERTTSIKLILIFSGPDLLYIGNAK